MDEPTESASRTSPASAPAFETSVEFEEAIVRAYRRMSAAEKLRRVGELGRFLEDLATYAVRARHPLASPEEVRRRVAARSYDRETMIRFFGWDPAERGA